MFFKHSIKAALKADAEQKGMSGRFWAYCMSAAGRV